MLVLFFSAIIFFRPDLNLNNNAKAKSFNSLTVEAYILSAGNRGVHVKTVDGKNLYLCFTEEQVFLRQASAFFTEDELKKLKTRTSKKLEKKISELEKVKKICKFQKIKIRLKKVNQGGFVYGNFSTLESKNYVLKALYSASRYLRNTFEDSLGTFEGALLYSLLTGEKNYTDPIVMSDIYKIGLGHIFAISGLHIGFIYLLLKRVLEGWFKLSRENSFWLASFFLIIFLFFTAIPASGLRAFLMILLYEISNFLKRHSNTGDLLLLAGCILIAVEPQLLFNPGFQFSFFSVAGIAFIYPELKKALETKRKKRISAIGSAVLLIFSVQIAVLPLQAIYFKTIPVLGALSNLVIVPLVSFFLPGAFLLSIFSILKLKLSTAILAAVLKFALKSAILTGHYFAKIPLSYVYFSKDKTETAFQVFRFLIFAFLFFLIFKHNDKRPLFFTGIALACLLNTYGLKGFYVFDAGQAGAVGVSLKHSSILLDSGNTRSNVYEKWKHFNLKPPKLIFLSHYHLDHIGGIFNLLSGFRFYLKKPTVFLPPPSNDKEKIYYLLVKKAAQKTGYRISFIKPLDLKLDDVFLKVRLPGKQRFGDPNERSAFFALSFLKESRKFSVFYPADAVYSSFSNLKAKDFHVVVAPHHGSFKNMDERFYHGFKGTVVIQADKNPYGLPSQSFLKFLKTRKINYRRTDREGTVIFAF